MNRPYSARDHLPVALYRAADVRAMDQQVMHNEGISALQLMGRAAEAAFACLLQRWPQARSLIVLAGPGNNGGDAWLLAGLAQAHGLDVQLYSLGDPAREPVLRRRPRVSKRWRPVLPPSHLTVSWRRRPM